MRLDHVSNLEDPALSPDFVPNIEHRRNYLDITCLYLITVKIEINMAQIDINDRHKYDFLKQTDTLELSVIGVGAQTVK